jgi:hypothetical protein
MKNLQYIAIAAAFLLIPAFALAQTASTTASTTRPLPPPPFKLGPAIKQLNQDMRPGARNPASTTREAVKDRVDAKRLLIDQHRADVRAMVERKAKGPMSSTTLAQMQQKREEMRGKLELKKEEVKDRLEGAVQKAQEKFGEAVQRSIGNIVEKLTKAVEHLTAIADRIDKRIDEREAEGKNMSVSVGLLATARTDIAAAQDKITLVGTVLTTALASTTPKGELPKVRAAVKTAEDALKKAKESLQKTLESVRIEAAATSTTTI